MAVQNDTSRVAYAGNASTVTPYPVGFYFFNDADLVVTVTDEDGADTILSLNSDYTVTGAGNEAGGSVITGGVAVPATNIVTIARVLAATQLTQYENLGKFPASSHERALDRLTMIAQQNGRKADLSIKVRESDGARNPVAAIANTIIGLDGSRQPKAMTVSEVKTFLALSGVTLDVAAGMKTFADAGERAAAVPDFTGQLGTQRDTNLVYISTGTTAGDWGLFSLSLAMLASGFFTADSDGRGKFANAFVNAALLASDAVETAKILDAAVTVAKLAATLDLSGKTLTMPANHWRDIAPAGSVLQTVENQLQTAVTITATIPHDNTIPQISEGTQVLSDSITPSSSANKVLVRVNLQVDGFNSQVGTMALFRNSTADAIAVAALLFNYGGGICQPITLDFLDAPSTTSAVTYSVRFGANANNTYINRSVSAALYGDRLTSLLTLQEIKG